MARPKKSNIEYFLSPSNFYGNSKIRKILRIYGVEGVAVYDFILRIIYGNSGYYVEYKKEDFADAIVDGLYLIGADAEARVENIVEYCINKGLFNKTLFDDYGILTSKTIQETWVLAMTGLRRTNYSIKSKYNLLTEETEINSENFGENTEETEINSENTEVFSENTGVSYNPINKLINKENKENIKEKPSAKPNFVFPLFKSFCNLYLESRSFEFEADRDIELKYAKKLREREKEKYPEYNDEEINNSVLKFISECLAIKDEYYKKQISLRYIYTNTNILNSIIQGGTNGQTRIQQQAKAGVDLSYFGINSNKVNNNEISNEFKQQPEIKKAVDLSGYYNMPGMYERTTDGN